MRRQATGAALHRRTTLVAPRSAGSGAPAHPLRRPTLVAALLVVNVVGLLLVQPTRAEAAGAPALATRTVSTGATTAIPGRLDLDAGAGRWTVPDNGTLTVLGHGWGHGHGMSQWGAQGAAKQGLDAAAILRFYYPGTQRAQATGRVRVLLSGTATPDLVVRPTSGLAAKGTGESSWRALPQNGADLWRAHTRSDGRVVLGYHTAAGDRWHRFALLTGQGQFYAAEAPVTLLTPSGDRPYRGILESLGPNRGVVDDVLLDDYLRGVVPRESPGSWLPAALRAQAIAARTYAAYEMAHPLSSSYQICDTSSCQVYGGVAAEYPTTDAAVAATAGRIITFQGRAAFTQFSASNGGWTAAGSAPYLVAREDPYDGWSGNPVHTWKVGVTTAAVERAYPAVGNLTSITIGKRDGNGEWGGRVVSMTLRGSRGAVTVSGDDVRSRLGLRSTWFTLG